MSKIFVATLSLLLSLLPSLGALAADHELLDRMLREEAKFGRLSRIEQLVREGADVNGRAPYGETALYYAVLFGRVKAAIRLIELGADPDARDDLDRTPLLKAADDCNYRVVNAALKAGADVNQFDFFGRTPLINASESGCLRVVAVILTRAKGRVDLEAQDHSFRSARDYATHPWIQAMLDAAAGKVVRQDPVLPMIRLP